MANLPSFVSEWKWLILPVLHCSSGASRKKPASTPDVVDPSASYPAVLPERVFYQTVSWICIHVLAYVLYMYMCTTCVYVTYHAIVNCSMHIEKIIISLFLDYNAS